MSAIFDALATLTEDLNARGLNATMDPRTLRLPGAVVDLNAIGPDSTLCGDITATARVTLVAPDHSHPRALELLTEMFGLITDLTTGADTAAWTLPDQGTMPALVCNPIPLDME